LGLDFDCEYGGDAPEDDDEDMPPSEGSDNEDSPGSGTEGEADQEIDYGYETDGMVHKQVILKDPPEFEKKKKRAVSKQKKRTKLEALPEDEDYEEEDEIGGSPGPGTKESSYQGGVRIPMQNINKIKEQSEKASPVQTPVNRNHPAKAGTLSNSPFSKPTSTPDKSVTTANVNLYGGNIYLLGGNHVMAGN